MNDENTKSNAETAGDELNALERDSEELLSNIDGQIARLTEDLETARQDVLYARAETQNVRRRLEKDIADARAYAATGFARDILSVADNLSRALTSIPAELREDEKLKGLVSGIEAKSLVIVDGARILTAEEKVRLARSETVTQ